MSETSGSAWACDWRKRLYDSVREKGFSSALDFVKSEPLDSFVSLAQKLRADVAPAQLIEACHIEAKETGDICYYFKSSLIRALHRGFPNGWPPNATAEEIAVTGGLFSANVGDEFGTLPLDLFREIRDNERPLTGWLPVDFDDPILRRAFESVELVERIARIYDKK